MLLLAAVTLTACADDADTGEVERARYDFVTYLGYADGTARWRYVGPGDSGQQDLLAVMDEPEKIKPGQRVLLSYTAPDASHHIKVKGINYGNVASDSLRVNVKPVADYPKHPIKLGAIWRTGRYINLRCEVEYTGKARALYLMADRASLGRDTIEVHLVHDIGEGADTYFWRTCYGSYEVGAAIDRESCHVIRVHVADLTYPSVKTYCFEVNKKQTNE